MLYAARKFKLGDFASASLLQSMCFVKSEKQACIDLILILHLCQTPRLAHAGLSFVQWPFFALPFQQVLPWSSVCLLWHF